MTASTEAQRRKEGKGSKQGELLTLTKDEVFPLPREKGERLDKRQERENRRKCF